MNRMNSCYTYYIRSSILSLSLLYTLDNIIIVQGVGLVSLAHSLFTNFETVVSTGWRAGIDCKRAGWRSGQGRGDMCGPCTY